MGENHRIGYVYYRMTVYSSKFKCLRKLSPISIFFLLLSNVIINITNKRKKLDHNTQFNANFHQMSIGLNNLYACLRLMLSV